jgi:hypothetical protein
MSAVNEFTIKKYRPGQHMEMFVAEFEGLEMRLEAICHSVSEQMRVVDILHCYALLGMRPLSIPCAECSVVISCRKVDYDESG